MAWLDRSRGLITCGSEWIEEEEGEEPGTGGYSGSRRDFQSSPSWLPERAPSSRLDLRLSDTKRRDLHALFLVLVAAADISLAMFNERSPVVLDSVGDPPDRGTKTRVKILTLGRSK